jgi:hypothetical protein
MSPESKKPRFTRVMKGGQLWLRDREGFKMVGCIATSGGNSKRPTRSSASWTGFSMSPGAVIIRSRSRS